VSDRAPSNVSRGSSTPPAATPPSDSLWVRWTRVAPGMQPIITVFAAVATLMVAFSAYYSGVIKAQERIDREKLCNLVGYRNSAYFVGRYVIDTLTSNRHGNPDAQTTAIFKASDTALNAIPLKDLPGSVAGNFLVLIAASDLTEAYASKINKEDPNDPTTMLSESDQQMLKKADERLEAAMAAIDEELARFGVTFTTNASGVKVAIVERCQPAQIFISR
jgi:hypothetical protein